MLSEPTRQIAIYPDVSPQVYRNQLLKGASIQSNYRLILIIVVALRPSTPKSVYLLSLQRCLLPCAMNDRNSGGEHNLCKQSSLIITLNTNRHQSTQLESIQERAGQHGPWRFRDQQSETGCWNSRNSGARSRVLRAPTAASQRPS